MLKLKNLFWCIRCNYILLLISPNAYATLLFSNLSKSQIQHMKSQVRNESFTPNQFQKIPNIEVSFVVSGFPPKKTLLFQNIGFLLHLLSSYLVLIKTPSPPSPGFKAQFLPTVLSFSLSVFITFSQKLFEGPLRESYRVNYFMPARHLHITVWWIASCTAKYVSPNTDF